MSGIELWIVVFAFLLSTAITGLMILYARRVNLMDVPNQRSSHVAATPRGGGIGIVVCFLGGVFVLWVVDMVTGAAAIGMLLAGILVATIGFVDDHKHVPAIWRFLAQTVAAVVIVGQLAGLPALSFGEVTVDLGIIGDTLLVVFAVWFTNAFNFMDGIDGIAASEAICIAGGAIVIGLPIFNSTSLLAAVLAAACLGFLVWNWPPAKVFMGDVASAFLGSMLIAVGLYSAHQDFISLWSWLILSGVFVVDSTMTLVTRIVRGEDWYSAHRSHAYQRLAKRLGSHAQVTLGVITLNVCWLLPFAFLANSYPGHGWWLLIAAWLPLVAACARLRPRREEVESSA